MMKQMYCKTFSQFNCSRDKTKLALYHNALSPFNYLSLFSSRHEPRIQRMGNSIPIRLCRDQQQPLLFLELQSKTSAHPTQAQAYSDQASFQPFLPNQAWVERGSLSLAL